MKEEPKVAIACQGGGSHTAFTAGVLRRLFREGIDGDVVGFSGTSGGAMCALLSWYGRVSEDEDPRRLLESYWKDIAANTPTDALVNGALLWGMSLKSAGVPLPEVNPYYSPASEWGQKELRRAIESLVDFEEARRLAAEDGAPALFVSAVDVHTGEFEIFREEEISSDVMLASAAEPSLFEAVEVDGSAYWDGLFSKNPPVDSFVVADDVPHPDEIWVVQINPQKRGSIPKTIEGIMDRRNELAGNLSLNSDVRFIERVNDWVDNDHLPDGYTHTEVERIRYDGDGDDWRTKKDRSPEFIEHLMEEGEKAADEFLAEK